MGAFGELEAGDVLVVLEAMKWRLAAWAGQVSGGANRELLKGQRLLRSPHAED